MAWIVQNYLLWYLRKTILILIFNPGKTENYLLRRAASTRTETGPNK